MKLSLLFLVLPFLLVVCYGDVESTPTPVGTSAPLKCSDNPCGAAACCDDGRGGAQCYNEDDYDCTDNGDGRTYLCPQGTTSCNTNCFDPSKYDCCNGELAENGTCGCKMGNCQPHTSPPVPTSVRTASPSPRPTVTATVVPTVASTVASTRIPITPTAAPTSTPRATAPPPTPAGNECPYGYAYSTDSNGTQQCTVRYFYLQSVLNNLVVDINGTEAGSTLVMQPLSTSAVNNTQVWSFEQGYFINRFTKFVVDIYQGNSNPGSKCIVWYKKEDGDIRNQLWKYNQTSYKILSQINFVVLDIYRANTAPGTYVEVYGPKTTNNANQQFKFKFL